MLVRNRDAFQQRYGAGPAIAGIFANGSGLSNSGEQLQLLARNGSVIRGFGYHDETPWPTAADGLGPCLVLVQPETGPDHAVAENWRLSEAVGGQPGADDRLGYASWRLAQFSAAEASNDLISGYAADPDSDGVTNGLEYAIGTNPKSADAQSQLPSFTLADFDPGTGPVTYGWFSLRVRRAAEDVVFVAESGPDLAAWSPEPSGMIRVGVVDFSDGTGQILWRTVAPIGASNRLFVRIRSAAP